MTEGPFRFYPTEIWLHACTCGHAKTCHDTDGKCTHCDGVAVDPVRYAPCGLPWFPGDMRKKP